MILDAEMIEIARVFFQECREGLDVMESGLLGLDSSSDSETINTIFRAAHSIKGGAATFGFAEVAGFTHGVETLLDDMRKGARAATPEAIRVLLKSCDCLREMLAATETKSALDEERIAALNAELGRVLADLPPASTPSTAVLEPLGRTSAPAARKRWRIVFQPVKDLLKLRNEPTRMFAELQRLGDLVVHTSLAALPDLDTMDAQSCYLSWELELEGAIQRRQLDDIFDWVDAGCRLEILELSAAETRPREAAPAPPALPVPTASATTNASPRAKAGAEAASIRVATDKLDGIINLVGELLITQSMLAAFAEGLDVGNHQLLRKGLSQLARNTRELQDSVMQVRMLPISFAFNRFPRLVHDLSQKLGKSVAIKLEGENTELDKTVLEKISDPLVHLVRNSLDHGLETPDVRVAAGKRAVGTIELVAFHEGGSIIIEVRDDGAGLNRARILAKARERGIVGVDQELNDEQIDNLIFMPGFSTAEQISDVSGRGVGMDVVRRNINDLGGHVQISSGHGRGSTVRIRLPLTLAILDGQLVRVGKETYVISLLSIVETIQVSKHRLNSVPGGFEVFRLRDEYVPVIRLSEAFDIEADNATSESGLLVVVEADNRRVCLLVDDLLAQQQVVIKSIDTNFRPVAGIAGATILGDGAVALIIDVRELVRPSSLISHPSVPARAA